MSTYRLSGILKAQREVFRHYYDPPSTASRNRLLSYWKKELQTIERILREARVLEQDLNANSRCALFNLNGLVALHFQEAHPYVNMYRRIERIIPHHFPSRKPVLVLQLSPSQHLRHRLRIQNGKIYLQLSVQVLELSDDYPPAITEYLILRAQKRPVPPELKAQIARLEKSFSPPPGATVPERVSPIQLQPRGRFFNLEEIFRQLNRDYFQNTLALPHLGWTQRFSRRRLGFYDSQRNLLNISRILDHPAIPRFVVEGILFHEMLHMVYPIRIQNGRRVVHGKEFKEAEKHFSKHRELQHWLKNELPRLLGQTYKRKRSIP